MILRVVAILLLFAQVAQGATASYTIQLRRDTPANWAKYNPILAAGEVGCELSGSPARCTAQKIGDGVTAWGNLPYFANTTPRPALAANNIFTGFNNFSGLNATDIVAGGPTVDVRRFYHGASWESAFNAGVAYVAAKGGTLLIPAGSYSVPAGIAFDGGHTNRPFRIMGVGGVTLTGPNVAGGAAPVHVLSLSNVDDVEITGIRIGYASVTTRNDSYKSLAVTHSSKVDIHGIEVFNSMSAGVVIDGYNPSSSTDGLYGYTVRNSYIHDTLADGVIVTNTGGGVKLTNNRVDNTGDDSLSICTFKGAGSYYSKSPVITGNIITGGAARGIYLGGTIGAAVTGNTVTGKQNGGIVAGYESDPTATKENYTPTISGNTISDIGVTSPGDFPHGVVINHLNVGALVAANNIKNIAAGTGVMFRGSGKVIGNLIDTTGSTTVGWGIYVGTYDPSYASYVSNCFGEVNHNTIRNTSRHAVYVARTAAEGFKIQGNTAINCVAPANYAGDGSPYFQSIGTAEFLHNYLYDSRSGVTMNYMVHVDTGNFMSEGNRMYVTSGYTTGTNYIGLSATTARGTRKTRLSVTPTVGDNAVYGTGTDVNPIDLSVLKYQAASLAAGEQITVKVRALYADGDTEYFEHILTDGNGVVSTPTEVFTLFGPGEKSLVKWTVYAKSNQTTHTGSVTVYLAGNVP